MSTPFYGYRKNHAKPIYFLLTLIENTFKAQKNNKVRGNGAFTNLRRRRRFEFCACKSLINLFRSLQDPSCVVVPFLIQQYIQTPNTVSNKHELLNRLSDPNALSYYQSQKFGAIRAKLLHRGVDQAILLWISLPS